MVDIFGGTRSTGADGAISKELKDHLDRQARSAVKAQATLTATTTELKKQPWPIFIEFPDNKDYVVCLNSPVAFTINTVTTKCSTGTCTLAVKINTTALGGTANSVSTSETTQTHSSANVVAVGDDVRLTVSANSSAENVAVMIYGTRA